ncbi:MAG: DUF3500 domain-containing protein [Myxococcota bacterium]
MSHRGRWAGIPVRMIFVLAAGFIAGAGAVAGTIDDERALLVARVRALIDALAADQQAVARHAPFDSRERMDLRLAPLFLEGLPLAEMDTTQRRRLEEAFAIGLSDRGREKVAAIRSLEREVLEVGHGPLNLIPGMRSPDRYFLSIFGDASPGRAFGLRFDGHHVSMNWTSVPGRAIAYTPLFLGAEPSRVPDSLPRAGLRVLAAEEDLALALLETMTAAERDRARIGFARLSGQLYRPMFVTGDPVFEPGEPEGIPRSALSGPAARALDDLIEVYLSNFAPPVAARLREGVAGQAGTSAFAFGRRRGDGEPRFEPGRSLYYRIQAGDLVIEYDNTAPSADHVHSMVRHSGDFGGDLLAEHRRSAHAGEIEAWSSAHSADVVSFARSDGHREDPARSEHD